MKKIIIGLAVVLIVLVSILAVVGQGSSAKLYSDADHLEYSELGQNVLGTNLFYFYQESCSHCNNIKEDVNNFYRNQPADVNFFLIDAADATNQEVWDSSEDFVTPSGRVTDYSDIKIQGTPTLIEVKDGVITQFLVGETDIPTYLDGLLG